MFFSKGSILVNCKFKLICLNFNEQLCFKHTYVKSKLDFVGNYT